MNEVFLSAIDIVKVRHLKNLYIPHCNRFKNNRKYDEKILDCCKVEPEKFINHI